MPDVDLPDRPVLAVIPGVELLEVGMNWPLMSDGTEDGTFTPEDLAAAVAAAQGDPSVRAPVVKFGHTAKLDPLGDGAPVWGRATNLRLENNGMTLVCDLAGVPAWLADVMPSAWPSRSVEARRNSTSDTGRTHELVIDAVALLGVQLPAISTLAEVRAVWAARSPEAANITVKETTMPTTAGRRPAQVAAAVDHEDILRAYYESLPSGDWSWVRRLQLAPTMALLVDDDNGRLWRIPVLLDGDAVSFGDPVEVTEPAVDDYVPVAAGATTSASRAGAESIVFASRDESRKGVAGMDPVELRKSVGLAETATDEEVMAAISKRFAEPDPTAAGTGDQPPATGTPAPTGTTGTPAPSAPPATPPAPPATPVTPPAGFAPPAGFRLVSEAVDDEREQAIAAGKWAAQTLAKQAEDAFIARHRRRIGPESNPHAKRVEEHMRREWQRNQGEAEAFAAALHEGPATTAAGHEGGGEDGVADTFNGIVSQVWPGVAAVRAERAKRGS